MVDAAKPIRPVASVEAALQLVDSFVGKPEDFLLAVPEALLDAVGINMAIITDRVLARGWQPDGYIRERSCRIYRFKELE